MLTIRPEQLEVLADASREEFVCRMEQHVREHFAPVVASLTKEQLREVIARNRNRAESYGLKSELGICSYLNVVFTLGEDFEDQREYPWAKTLLSEATATERSKLDRLAARVESVLTKE